MCCCAGTSMRCLLRVCGLVPSPAPFPTARLRAPADPSHRVHVPSSFSPDNRESRASPGNKQIVLCKTPHKLHMNWHSSVLAILMTLWRNTCVCLYFMNNRKQAWCWWHSSELITGWTSIKSPLCVFCRVVVCGSHSGLHPSIHADPSWHVLLQHTRPARPRGNLARHHGELRSTRSQLSVNKFNTKCLASA